MISRLNHWKWPFRWAAKGAAAVVLFVVVLFPRLDRLPRTLYRQQNPGTLIQPDAPELAPLYEEFDARRRSEWPDDQLLKEIERFVYQKLPYEWDWNLWSNADYFPTVAEALAVGKEDCDGRAVVAASMLCHYGFQATLVTDFKHVWVATDRGETMGPGKVTGVRFTEQGPQFDWRVLKEFPATLAFGVAVFPLGRELILATGLWLLLLGHGRRPRDRLIMLLAVFFGLMLVREGGSTTSSMKQWLGLAVIAMACLAMFLPRRRGVRGFIAQAVDPPKITPLP